MDNDANVGALGEGSFGAGAGFDPLFYMTLSTGIGGGIIIDGKILRGADSYAGEIGHLTIHPDGFPCLCGARGCFERHCCGLWLQRDHGRSARELLQDPDFVRRYVVDLALGLKACLMLLNPGAHRDRRRHRQSRRRPLPPPARGTRPPDPPLVARPHRRRPRPPWATTASSTAPWPSPIRSKFF